MKLAQIIDILSFLGSFGIFIYGLKHMSESLQRIAGERLRGLFSRLTQKSIYAVFLGFLLTGIVQSSSATTVIIVGFVNANVLTVAQSIPTIMGANIGTTITGFLVSFLGFDVNIPTLILPVLGISIPLVFSGIKNWKTFAEGIIGLYLIFFGFHLMKQFIPQLENYPEILQFISSFSHLGFVSILLYILIGAILTLVVQSSSAALSVTLVMLSKGWLPYDLAAAMILGMNIGTTSTAIIASMVGNYKAKQAALSHFIFNFSGLVWVIPLFYVFLSLSKSFVDNFLEMDANSGLYQPLTLATFHTSFNILNTVLLLPFVKKIEQLVKYIIKPSSGNEEAYIGTSYLIETPELLLLEAQSSLSSISSNIKELFTMNKALLFNSLPETEEEEIIKKFEKTYSDNNTIEFNTSNFLKGLTQSDIGQRTSNSIVSMLSILHELNKINSLCSNIKNLYYKKASTYTEFKTTLEKGLFELFLLVDESLNSLITALREKEKYDLSEAGELEQKINDLRDDLRLKHLKRIKSQKLGIGTSILYRDLYSSLEKIADHTYNIQKLLQAPNE